MKKEYIIQTIETFGDKEKIAEAIAKKHDEEVAKIQNELQSTRKQLQEATRYVERAGKFYETLKGLVDLA